MYLTDEQREKQPLLESRNIITTPPECNYAMFREMEWALEYARHNSNKLRPLVRVAGDGGDSGYAFGIGELIQDANAFTVLLGSAYSSHVIIWASGGQRFIYDTALLGIHSSGIYVPTDSRLTEHDFITHARNCQAVDKSTAILFSSCCLNKKYNVSWWYKKIREHRDATYNISGAEVLDKFDMANHASLITDLRKI